jgi:hypothetical protein
MVAGATAKPGHARSLAGTAQARLTQGCPACDAKRHRKPSRARRARGAVSRFVHYSAATIALFQRRMIQRLGRSIRLLERGSLVPWPATGRLAGCFAQRTGLLGQAIRRRRQTGSMTGLAHRRFERIQTRPSFSSSVSPERVGCGGRCAMDFSKCDRPSGQAFSGARIAVQFAC